MSEQKLLGTWPLGHSNVDVYVLPKEAGGWFSSVPDKTSKPHIGIGIDYPQHEWWRVVSVLMHEAQEMVMANQLNLRFVRDNELARNSADYFFHMDHQQFAEVVARSADFIAAIMPPLAKVFNARFVKCKKMRRKK